MHCCSTPGDRDKATDLRLSDPDFFTRDLHQAVLRGDIDCAVHSAKDLEEPVCEGIDWVWLPAPADSRDVLVFRCGETVERPGAGKVAGVSSLRREDYCRRVYPGLQLRSVRGTIEERLHKLDAGEYDLLILAAAGLLRLGLESRISKWISPEELPPPDGQGSLALTFRAGDERFQRLRSLFVKPVVFVGAGPAGRDLCTGAGAAALAGCEVCLHDALVDPSLLDRLPAGALRVPVGKRCGRHTVEQDEICRLLTQYARRGCKVVRLKGGDPGLFGRLAEETESLESLGLPFRVIPGVSSLAAATTGTGLLLTRRGLSRAFTVLTPRGAEGRYVSMTADEIRAAPRIYFMAGSVLREVAGDLSGQGVAPDLPAAVVRNAGLESQRVWTGTLASLGQAADAAEATDPVLLVIGDIAAAKFLYHPAGALKGMRVALTCSAALQDRAAAAVEAYGGKAVRRPLIRLEPEPAARVALAGLHAFDWLILTSPSAVECLVRLLEELGTDWRKLPNLMVSGPGTAAELRKFHLRADAEAGAAYGAQGLLDMAQARLTKGASILRCRSDRSEDRISKELAGRGLRVTDCVLYRNVPVHYDRQPECDAVIFASGSAVRAWIANWGIASLAGKIRLAIGPVTAAALEECGIKASIVAPEATVESAAEALAAHTVWQDLCAGGKSDGAASEWRAKLC